VSAQHRYRAEVVGSLLRPAALMQARRRRQRGELTEAQLRQAEDRAVEGAIALQERAGIDIITDGELRREFFVGNLADKLDGVARKSGMLFTWRGSETLGEAAVMQPSPLVIAGKLRARESIFSSEFIHASTRCARPLKITLPSPMTAAFLWHPRISAAAYRDPFELFEDFARVLREEISELRRHGCRNIQIDAPELATLVDPGMRRFWHANGIDPDRMLTEGLDLLNWVAQDSEETRFSLHLCRGNHAGHWLASGDYAGISQAAFPRLRAYHALLLEYDSQRAGSFATLKEIPEDTVVVLGLVSTKSSALEDAERVAARIREASQFISAERLALSPQCGFASVATQSGMSEEMQFRKLKLVADVAHSVLP
jgi:5-methyltetrahydropteroyltriglutamate--homocysteine methyltransferase